ncbi:MAG: HEAT repeat domain-containing protein, partial [Planctomycetaceae bacterium]
AGVRSLAREATPHRDAGVSRRDRLLLRRTAVDGIAAIGPNAYASVPQLLRCAKDPDTELQRKSLIALGAMGSLATPAGINQLVDTLRSGDAPEVRDAAVEGLSTVGADAVPQLMAILDPDKEIDADDKARAALALGKMGPIAKDALEVLDSALDDEDPWVRINAAEAIWRISGQTTSPASALVLELESPDRQVRIRAVRLFTTLGPRAKSAEPALKRLLTHKRGRVRRAATMALRAIQRPNR